MSKVSVSESSESGIHEQAMVRTETGLSVVLALFQVRQVTGSKETR